MLIVPILYLQAGKCVYPLKEIEGGVRYELVSDDPIDLAGRWMDRGARRLQIVDLDGEEVGVPQQLDIVAQITGRFPNLEIALSGGVKDLPAVAACESSGAAKIVVELSQSEGLEWLEDANDLYPDKISVMLTVSELEALGNELFPKLNALGLSETQLIDWPSEERQQGISLKHIVDTVESVNSPLMVFGGVTDLADVKAIGAQAFKGISGVLVGSALYDGSVDLLEAQHYCDNAHRFA